MGNTKNLGQVAGVHIGSTPPENIILIWYDNTPNQMRHKVYDTRLNQWVILDQNIISSITYSELVNIAKNVGLPIGQYYKINDKGGVLAIAVTTTKVQYSDTLGNILVDDLGTNIQYHVASSNLTIDDVSGVFDSTNKKLIFQFNETTPDYSADDFIFGKIKRNNVWKLAKYKLSSLLSKVSGNSISWNGGFFFNFIDALKNQLDKKGGVVSKDAYDTDIQSINQSIQNVGNANQQIISNTNQSIQNATSDSAIYGKKSPTLNTTGEPTDVVTGDTLLTILSKFQKYITRFKFATGIRISSSFTDNVSPSYINNNDTVDSALRKVQYWLKNAGKGSKLSSDWAPKNYSETFADVSGGDTLDEAFSKAVGKLNQIGDITDGSIHSKASIMGSSDKRTLFNLKGGSLTFNRDYSNPNQQVKVELSRAIGLRITNSDNKGVYASGGGLEVFSKTTNGFPLPTYEDYWGLGTVYGAASALVTGQGTNIGPYSTVKIAAAISAICTQGELNGAEIFDAYFSKLKAGSVSYGRTNVQDKNLYLGNNCSFVTCMNTEAVEVFLPSSPLDGQMIMVHQLNSISVTVRGNGRKIIDETDFEDYVYVSAAKKMAIFLYHGNLPAVTGQGAWLFFRWSI